MPSSPPPLSQRARDLRTQIIDSIIKQDKNLVKELQSQNDDDNDEENDQSHQSGNQQQQKWIVGSDAPGSCATCDLVNAIQDFQQQQRRQNSISASSSSSKASSSAESLLEFLTIEHEQTTTTTSSSSSSSPFTVKSVPRCDNHDRILWNNNYNRNIVSDRNTNSSNYQNSNDLSLSSSSDDLLFKKLNTFVATIWSGIWKQCVETLFIITGDEENNEQNTSSSNASADTTIIGINLQNHLMMNTTRHNNNLHQQKQQQQHDLIFSSTTNSAPAECKILMQLAKFSNTLLPSSSQARRRIINFQEVKLLKPLFAMIESMEILRSQTKTCTSMINFFQTLDNIQTFGAELEYLLKCSCHRQLQALADGNGVAVVAKGHSDSASPITEAVRRIIVKTFSIQHIHGLCFATSMNSQYAKLVDATSKFWGSHVKTVVAAENLHQNNNSNDDNQQQSPKQYDGNNYVLISHPVQWFVQMLKKNYNHHGHHHCQLPRSIKKEFLRTTLLWLRSWIFLSPVNKFGMSQKFGDVIWLLKEVTQIFSTGDDDDHGDSDQRHDCETKLVIHEIVCFALLHFIPIEQLLSVSKDSWQKEEIPIDEVVGSILKNSNNSNASSSGIIELSSLFPNDIREKIIKSSNFWRIVSLEVSVRFGDEGSNKDKTRSGDERSFVSLPSLSELQGDVSAKTAFQSKRFVEEMKRWEDGSSCSPAKFLLVTRFECFDQTYPMPTEEEVESMNRLLLSV